MNVPIQPSSLPSWALTDEDVNQGLVKDIETLPTPITRPHQLSDWMRCLQPKDFQHHK